MATPAWQVSGQYYETYNCDFVCPCVPGGLTVRPTKGSCSFATAFAMTEGSTARLRSPASGSSSWGSRHRRWRRATGLNADSSEPMHLDHTGHPAADRFALAHASRSRVHALGLSWEDASGKNNGQYAPFSWRNS
jgi:hypothetical protein